MSKAIEILILNMLDQHKKMPADVKDALNLAINSMDTIQYMRKGGTWSLMAPFPNEAPWEESQ
jgi:hypothetical protein